MLFIFHMVIPLNTSKLNCSVRSPGYLVCPSHFRSGRDTSASSSRTKSAAVLQSSEIHVFRPFTGILLRASVEVYNSMQRIMMLIYAVQLSGPFLQPFKLKPKLYWSLCTSRTCVTCWRELLVKDTEDLRQQWWTENGTGDNIAPHVTLPRVITYPN